MMNQYKRSSNEGKCLVFRRGLILKGLKDLREIRVTRIYSCKANSPIAPKSNFKLHQRLLVSISYDIHNILHKAFATEHQVDGVKILKLYSNPLTKPSKLLSTFKRVLSSTYFQILESMLLISNNACIS